MTKKQEPSQEQIEVKNVKHSFTEPELSEIGGRLARTIGELRGIEGEFDQVKASFKARVTECESKIDRLSTDRMNGFEMRDKRCVVVACCCLVLVVFLAFILNHAAKLDRAAMAAKKQITGDWNIVFARLPNEGFSNIVVSVEKNGEVFAAHILGRTNVALRYIGKKQEFYEARP